MEKQLIISVGREFGSGGHVIAKRLAEHFNLPLYERNMLKAIAEERNVDMEALEKFDEVPKKKLLSRTVRGYSNSPEEHIAQMQFDFIKKKASEGESFVVLGRCSEYILRDYEGLVSVFILGDRDKKIERTAQRNGIGRDAAIRMMDDHDRRRKAYHNSHCPVKWGDSRNYHLSINSSKLGLDATTEMVIDYIEERRKVSERPLDLV